MEIMQPKTLIQLAVCLCTLFLFEACRDSVTDSTENNNTENDQKPGTLVDPMKAAHVLYSPEQQLPVGSVLTQVETMKMVDAKMQVTASGREMSGTSGQDGKEKKITRFTGENTREVSYAENKLKTDTTVMGQAQPQTVKDGDLVGKTIIFTKKEGKWSGEFKGEEGATEEQEKKLSEKVNKLNDPDLAHILGTTPRKVGDSWEVDVTKLTAMGSGDSPPTGTFKVTFKTIEDYDGHSCGVFESDIDMTVKTEDGLSIQLAGKMKVHHSLKYLILLMSETDAVMTISGDIQGGAGSIKIVGPAKMREQNELKLP